MHLAYDIIPLIAMFLLMLRHYSADCYVLTDLMCQLKLRSRDFLWETTDRQCYAATLPFDIPLRVNSTTDKPQMLAPGLDGVLRGKPNIRTNHYLITAITSLCYGSSFKMHRFYILCTVIAQGIYI